MGGDGGVQDEWAKDPMWDGTAGVHTQQLSRDAFTEGAPAKTNPNPDPNPDPDPNPNPHPNLDPSRNPNHPHPNPHPTQVRQ